MIIQPFYMKENDLQPYYGIQVQNFDGTNVDLTGATVVCTLKLQGGVIKINRAPATVTAALTGNIEYRWAAGDTDTAGNYYIEFEISPAAGGKFTLPTSELAEVFIMPSLDTI